MEWIYDDKAMINEEKEKEIDEKIGIHTTECRMLEQKSKNYFNYQPTSYDMLEVLFDKYPFGEDDQFLDIGCGLGRVLFCAEKKGCKDCIGIEVNNQIYDELLDNIKKYEGRQSIRAYLSAAEKYEIEEKANKFFFFNPFHIKYFMRVMNNILKVAEKKEKVLYLFFYAPSDIYKEYLDGIEKVHLHEIIEPISENVHAIYVYTIN